MKIMMIMTGILAFAACGGGSGSAPAVPLSSAPDETSIAAVQGGSSVSPMVGQVVTVSGVVTGDFQENDTDEASNLGGFYVQQESSNDDNTSDAIFVFDGLNPVTDVSAGDRVSVRGTVQEYFGETQIVDPEITVTGQGVIQPIDITLPITASFINSDGDPVADLERYEGMLVRFPQSLTVTDLHNLERYGAVTLSQGGRLYQFTNGERPDRSAYAAHKAANARRIIELDDGLRMSNPADIRYLTVGSTPGYSIRIGDAITGVTGNLRFSRGSGGDGDATWRLMPTTAPRFDVLNPRPGAPETGGNLRIASFNVLNFFSAVDSGADVCGPRRDENCRGADSAAEHRRQLQKTVTALVLLDADIVGLMELENNAKESIAMLVDALNDRVGESEYDFVNTGTILSDTIKTGFIYRSSRITLQGKHALLDSSSDSRFNDDRNRPALAQTFRLEDNGSLLTVIVNHLKSKGSSCEADGDPNIEDGQGNCNRTRSDAAAAIADWITKDPTQSGDPDFLVIGDLNAYTMEDPLRALQDAGLVNLIEGRVNPYSIVYDKQAGALDHALATPTLVPQVADAIEWHINADEPRLLDYNLEHGRDPGLFDGDLPYRASDHDPVVIGIDLVD
jgi:predicted extracellular nuclease